MRSKDKGRLAERVLGLFLRLLILRGIISVRRRCPLPLSIRTGVGLLEPPNPAETLRRLRRTSQRLGLDKMRRLCPLNVGRIYGAGFRCAVRRRFHFVVRDKIPRCCSCVRLAEIRLPSLFHCSLSVLARG